MKKVQPDPMPFFLVSTQENKHRIGLDFFPSCIIRTGGPTGLKFLSAGGGGGADYRFKLKQKFGTEGPCVDVNPSVDEF